MIGAHEHDGIHHLLIRQSHGGSYQIPDWMFDPAASNLGLVSVPRIPLSQLVSLRSLVDHLVACPSKEGTNGGTGNEKTISYTIGAERQKAVALLRALLTEALITRSSDLQQEEGGGR